MNKFKLLALSLVCAIVAFGYNTSDAMTNNEIYTSLQEHKQETYQYDDVKNAKQFTTTRKSDKNQDNKK